MAPIHPSAIGKRAEAGFTLTELLVVLAILALIVAAVPVLVQSALPGMRTLSAARALANDLRATRGRAIASGATTDVRFDTARRTYIAEPGGATNLLPAGIAYLPHVKPGPIVFYPDGSSSGGAVTLGDGKTEHQLTVDSLTGRVALDE